MSKMIDQEDPHLRYLWRRIQELDEDRKEGRREVYLQIDDYHRLLVENIGLYQRIDRLEEMLNYHSLNWLPNKSILESSSVGATECLKSPHESKSKTT